MSVRRGPRAPRNAIFRTVNGIEEAFRPGTERRREEEQAPAPEIPVGPQNYNDVLRREQEEAAGLPPTTTPTPSTTPPPPKREPAEDLSGLYCAPRSRPSSLPGALYVRASLLDRRRLR